VQVNIDLLPKGWTRDKIIKTISESNVPCFSGSCSEVYKEKAFIDTPFMPKTSLNNAIELGNTSLMFLVHPTLTPTEMNKTCQVIAKIFANIEQEI
jgi:dTDP-4-amino-4,6-dideoxygalactose transaminase